MTFEKAGTTKTRSKQMTLEERAAKSSKTRHEEMACPLYFEYELIQTVRERVEAGRGGQTVGQMVDQVIEAAIDEGKKLGDFTLHLQSIFEDNDRRKQDD